MNLEELGDFRYETATLGDIGALGRLAGAMTPVDDVKRGGDRGSKVDPFDDE